MLRWFIAGRIDSAQKRVGESLDYLRYILSVSLRCFFAFMKMTSYAAFRKKLPRVPFHVVRIVTLKEEDCGPCVQTVVDSALEDGVPIDIVRAIVDGHVDALPEELAETYRFTDAVIRATYDEGDLREKLRRRWGDEALVELALVISGCRAYPITKRVLGYAQSCSKVVVRVGRPGGPAKLANANAGE
jgi:alkylhydroperoxidase family enzyme